MESRSSRNDLRKQRGRDGRDDRDSRRRRSRSRSRSRTRSPVRNRTLDRSRSPADQRSGDLRDRLARKSSDARLTQRGADEESSRRRRRSKSEEGEIDDMTPERERDRGIPKSLSLVRKMNEVAASANLRKTVSEARLESEKSKEPESQTKSVKSSVVAAGGFAEGYSRWLDSESEEESEVDECVVAPAPADEEQQAAGELTPDTDVNAEAAEATERGDRHAEDAETAQAEPEANGGTSDGANGRDGPEIAADPVKEAETSRKCVYFPAISGCRGVHEYDIMNRVEEGTYGVVYRARDKKRNEVVALKRLKMEKEKEGFPITSLREINTLLKAQHENIVTVREIVVGSNMDRIYVVMDYAEHDLRNLMESMRADQRFTLGEVKSLLSQLLAAVAHLHDNWILHRDLKTSNLLLTNGGVLKVGDFGLAREYGSPLKRFTPIVVTLWYRAPELLLGAPSYSTPIDIWSVGCIFAELLLFRPLWSGKSENEQLGLIFRDLGTPSERIWPNCSSLPLWSKLQFAQYPYNQLRNRFARNLLTDAGWSLLNRLFAYDPSKRIAAADARAHEYFLESPLPTEPSMFRTWPSRNETPVPRAPVIAHAAHAANVSSAANAQALAARRAAEALARKKRETPPPPVAGVGAQAQLLGKDDDY